MNETALLGYKAELGDELASILAWWKRYAVDKEQGGFYGSVDNNNIPDLSAVKGVVLNSRICWTFSAAYLISSDETNLQMATRAFDYILRHFVDHEAGGVFWSVDHHGKMLDGRKQIYGLAFCIYSLSEYYKASGNKIALQLARDLFNYIEHYSLDIEKGGYIEAFTRDWQAIEDLRLSDKDDNEKKTMNTHLHIIEGYTNLYQVWPDEILRQRIIALLEIFDLHFINKQTHHLNLFMDDEWQTRSSLQSFGHDIEAAWLLLETALIAGDEKFIAIYREQAIQLADAAIEGLDQDGGLWYEYEPNGGQMIREKHSWPQAEAMIGFLNAWQITGDEKYLHHSRRSWDFVKRYIRDKNKGEWLWGVTQDYSPMEKDKAGFWKCPYHNTRACMEIIRRINN